MTQIPFADADRILAEARHWMYEAEALYTLAFNAPADLPILEIGTWCGYSAGLMAAAGRQVITIDPHDPGLYNETQRVTIGEASTLEVAQRLWAGLGVADRITALVGTVDTVELPEQVGMVFIDADHHLDAIAGDLAATVPLVVPGGIVALHDWDVRGDEPTPWGVTTAAIAQFASDPETWAGPTVFYTLAHYLRRA